MMTEMMTMRTTMMTSPLPRDRRARPQQRRIPTRRTSLRAARRVAKREALLVLEVTSRSANSNEIKQFKMMLKIYHNDN